MKEKDCRNVQKKSVESITTTHKIFGRMISEKTVKKEVFEYVDLEEEGLNKKIKKVIHDTPSIPKDLRRQAETFISGIYADAKDYWNSSTVGDMEGIQLKAGFRIEVDEAQNAVGKTLEERNVKPKVLLRLCNKVFSTPEGETNKDFQEFLQRRINLAMNIKEEETELNIESDDF